jgi:hypothetical protein
VYTHLRSLLLGTISDTFVLPQRTEEEEVSEYTAKEFSRRLPTAAARVQNPGLVMCDFVMDKSGAGAGFLRELFSFPCQSTFYLFLHNHLHYHPRLAQ